jgi:Transposase DDE domain
VWVSTDSRKSWYVAKKGNKHGREHVYSNAAIEAALTMQAVFRLPLRALEGFVESIFALGKINLSCPDHSTFSRRRAGLDVDVKQRVSSNEPVALVVDSTGLKVYGEGEWKVRKHGASKRRTWRKLHLAVDAKTGMILAEELTENDVGDGEVLPKLLEQVDAPIEAVAADGAYDSKECYQAVHAAGAVPKIPPRRGAVAQNPQIVKANHDPALRPRDDAIKRITALGGDDPARKTWKVETGYHVRSLAETAMYRRKTLFAPKLSTRTIENQCIESRLVARAMNIMTSLGMPESYKVAA